MGKQREKQGKKRKKSGKIMRKPFRNSEKKFSLSLSLSLSLSKKPTTKKKKASSIFVGKFVGIEQFLNNNTHLIFFLFLCKRHLYIYIYINIYEVLFFTLSLYYTCYIVVGRNLIPSRHLGISFVLALHLCHPLYFQVISSPLFLCYPFNFLLHPPPLYFICTYIYIYIYISRHLNKQKDFISPPS